MGSEGTSGPRGGRRTESLVPWLSQPGMGAALRGRNRVKNSVVPGLLAARASRTSRSKYLLDEQAVGQQKPQIGQRGRGRDGRSACR
jgi:hypothetical protein